jgi:integrase
VKKTLTDAFISSLEHPARGRIEIADTRCVGLTLRVTSNGVKSWCFRFRARGTTSPSRLTLGSYPDIGLGKAREQASAMRSTVAAGGDPAQHRREERGGAKTFGALADRYLKEHADRHKRPTSAAADRRNLTKHVLPKWSNRPYASIRRADVIELVEGIIAAGKQTLANRVQALISKLFSFALDASLRDDHPCHRLKLRGVERVGRRVLSDAEIPLFWNGIVRSVVASDQSRRTGLALRLALLTGCRIGEIAGIARAELHDIANPASATWLIPGTRIKNKHDHLVPLAPLARGIVLELLAMIPPSEEFLLPTCSRHRAGPITGITLTQAMAYFTRRITGDDDAARTWRADPPSPHDLRRSVETRLAALGIAKEVRDRVLNHVQGDVGSKHYNQHRFVAEKRAALMRFEAALTAILAGDGAALADESAAVVPLAERRA